MQRGAAFNSTLPSYPRAVAHGDAGLAIEFGDCISPDINARVLALEQALAAEPIAGVTETVPTYRALMVHYDPVIISHAALEAKIMAAAAGRDATPARRPRRWTVPVCYGGLHGIDLDAVATHAGLSPADVVSIHASGEYRVYMLGFQPGFAYLGGLDGRLAMPRRPNPRPHAPAGTISIGGQQTAIQTVVTPSGWHWIGRTPHRNYRPDSPALVLIEPGDFVRFKSIEASAFDGLARAALAGEVVAEMEAA